MHFDGSNFVVRNESQSAGFDENNLLKVYWIEHMQIMDINLVWPSIKQMASFGHTLVLI